MLNPNKVLLEQILKRNFFFYLTVVNKDGEEKEKIYKKSRKDFLKEIENLNIRVIIVENYPNREDWKAGVFYLVKSGKAIYYKEIEDKMPIIEGEI